MISGNPGALTTQIAPWVIFGIVTLVLLDAYYGISISIRSKRITRTSHFVFKTFIEIGDIERITYEPTWILGSSLGKSIRVSGLRGGRAATIEIANVGFTESTLADMVRRLMEINKSIDIDKMTEVLLKSQTHL
jgi:hypothetical protein